MTPRLITATHLFDGHTLHSAPTTLSASTPTRTLSAPSPATGPDGHGTSTPSAGPDARGTSTPSATAGPDGRATPTPASTSTPHAPGVGSECRVAVLVEDGRVVAVGGLAELTARGTRGVQVDRYPGGTISPGLIDAHVHLTMPGDGTAYEPAAGAPAATRLALAVANLRAHLAAGVTTVRDLGSHLDLLAWTPDAAYALPRLLRAGPPVTTAGGHMRLFGGEVADAAGAARLAHRNLDAGADVIKIVASGGGTVGTVPHEASLDRAVIATAVDAAHTRHRRATTHAMSNASIRRAVEAGTDGVEHLAFLTPDGASGFDADVAELAVARRVVFGSTLGVNHAYIAAAERGDLDPYELDAQRERTASYVRNAALLRAAGALIVPASDSGWKHTRFGGFATELRLLAAAGYPPIEVLRLATSFAAAYVGLGDQVGALAPGLRADIAVFDGDPARDITRTAAVRAVYRDGLRVSTGQR